MFGSPAVEHGEIQWIVICSKAGICMDKAFYAALLLQNPKYSTFCSTKYYISSCFAHITYKTCSLFGTRAMLYDHFFILSSSLNVCEPSLQQREASPLQYFSM